MNGDLDVRLRDLALLRDVAEATSVREAARRSGVSQPTLSRHLARLEDQLGVVLLRRSSSGVTLTEAGAAVARRAVRIGDELAGLRVELDALAGRRQRTVAVGPSLSAAAIVPVLSAHGYEVRTTTVSEPTVFEMLRRGDVDLVYAVEHPDETYRPQDGTAAVVLMRLPMWVVMSEGHRFAGRARLSLGELRDEPWLLPPAGSVRDLTERAFRAAGFVPRRQLLADPEVLMEAVADGAGVALATPTTPAMHGYRLVVRPVEPAVAQGKILAWRRGVLDEDALDTVAATIRRGHMAQAALIQQYHDWIVGHPGWLRPEPAPNGQATTAVSAIAS